MKESIVYTKQIVVSEDHHQKVSDIAHDASSRRRKITMRDVAEYAIDTLNVDASFSDTIWRWKHRENEDVSQT